MLKQLLICFSWWTLTVHGFPQIDHHPPIHPDYDYFAVEIHEPSSFLDELSTTFSFTNQQNNRNAHAHQIFVNELNYEVIGQIGSLSGHYLVRKQSQLGRLNELQGHPSVKWAIHQQPKRRLFKRNLPLEEVSSIVANELQISDPGLVNQWHLINRNNREADINVTSIWQMGITGNGSTVALIDDGLDYRHSDLKDNFFPEGSYDFNEKRKEPLPNLSDDTHGTRCAGQIAARPNTECGIGVAYDSKVAGIRLLSGTITDVDEALALNYGFQENQIYSCSWGPKDDGQQVDGPNELVLNAIINGVKKGRGGLGSIFVFAIGNGGMHGDNCNYDGYTNSIHGISIGAIDANNKHPGYSELCTAHLASTYSSSVVNGESKGIYTTDITYGKPTGSELCTSEHGGTSAAAPIAVGIFALVLSVRPDLSYRDMQHLTIRTAIPIDTDDLDWETTYAGRSYSYKYGYGKLDAFKIVMEAMNWTKVYPQVKYESPLILEESPIPHGPTGVTFTYEVTGEMISDAEMLSLEHVTVTVAIEHERRGDLDISLTSPNGIISKIGPHRINDRNSKGFRNWTFSTVKHWDETPVGLWKLVVVDMFNPDHRGIVVSWQITLYGQASSDSPSIDQKNPENKIHAFRNLIILILICSVSIGLIYGILHFAKRSRSKRDKKVQFYIEEFNLEDEENDFRAVLIENSTTSLSRSINNGEDGRNGSNGASFELTSRSTREYQQPVDLSSMTSPR